MLMSCMKNLYFQKKIFLVYISTPWKVSEKPFYSKAMCLLWVMNFPRAHRRRRTPSDTFTNFHRWIHMSDKEYRCRSSILSLNTYILSYGCYTHPSFAYGTVGAPFNLSRFPSLKWACMWSIECVCSSLQSAIVEIFFIGIVP